MYITFSVYYFTVVFMCQTYLFTMVQYNHTLKVTHTKVLNCLIRK